MAKFIPYGTAVSIETASNGEFWMNSRYIPDVSLACLPAKHPGGLNHAVNL